jgi:hypothetical protein
MQGATLIFMIPEMYEFHADGPSLSSGRRRRPYCLLPVVLIDAVGAGAAFQAMGQHLRLLLLL